MKKRWICLFVENDVGVLARISGLFSGKSYNLDSLTVGITEDETVSRMTISLTSDDKTFEQVKKQLCRSIEVIKVVDYTDIAVHILLLGAVIGAVGNAKPGIEFHQQDFNGVHLCIGEIFVGTEEVFEKGDVLAQTCHFPERLRCIRFRFFRTVRPCLWF